MNQALERISKTLELANNNSNKNEAQNAILAAQRLMAKYHLSQEDVNDFVSEKENQDSKVIEEKAADETNNEKWKRRLMVTIAQNFRCDVYHFNRKLMLVGASEDIDITKRVYLYAKHSVSSSFKAFFDNKYGHMYVDATFRNKCKRDFAYGFINGLNEKFKEQKSNKEMALIVVNPKVEEYFETINFSGVFHSRRTKIEDSYCYSEGHKKGKTLADIDTQMEGEN